MAIPFSAEENLEELNAQHADWSTFHPGNDACRRPYHPAFVYLEIDERLVAENQAQLASLGLTAFRFEPRFDTAEFICQKCRYRSHEEEICPKHNLRLMVWEEYIAYRREKNKRLERWISLALLIFFIVLLAYISFDPQALDNMKFLNRRY